METKQSDWRTKNDVMFTVCEEEVRRSSCSLEARRNQEPSEALGTMFVRGLTWFLWDFSHLYQ